MRLAVAQLRLPNPLSLRRIPGLRDVWYQPPLVHIRSPRSLQHIPLCRGVSLDAKSTWIETMESGEPTPLTPSVQTPQKRNVEDDSASTDPHVVKRRKVGEDDDGEGTPSKAGESSTTAQQHARKGKFTGQSRKAAREKRTEEVTTGKRRGTRPEGAPAPDTGEPRAPRLPKRMSAIMLGFCGAGYSGMQLYVMPFSGLWSRLMSGQSKGSRCSHHRRHPIRRAGEGRRSVAGQR